MLVDAWKIMLASRTRNNKTDFSPSSVRLGHLPHCIRVLNYLTQDKLTTKNKLVISASFYIEKKRSFFHLATRSAWQLFNLKPCLQDIQFLRYTVAHVQQWLHYKIPLTVYLWMIPLQALKSTRSQDASSGTALRGAK